MNIVTRGLGKNTTLVTRGYGIFGVIEPAIQLIVNTVHRIRQHILTRITIKEM